MGSLSYTEWKQKVNEIVALAGTQACFRNMTDYEYKLNGGIHAWDEFDTNGLSYDAVAGVFEDTTNKHDNITGQGNATEAIEADVCSFMAKINEQRTVKKSKWPVYTFYVNGTNSSSLFLSRYLDCSVSFHMAF